MLLFYGTKIRKSVSVLGVDVSEVIGVTPGYHTDVVVTLAGSSHEL